MPLTSARPFQLQVPDAALADLRERLARTRFPDQAPGEPWAHGTQVEYLRELVVYWRDRFDWRAQEARLNALPQFKVPLHGIELHYLCVPGPGPRSMPAVAIAWLAGLGVRVPRADSAPHRPGSLRRRCGRLRSPWSHRRCPATGCRSTPGQARFGIEAIADCLADLMTDVLGYRRFAAQGGDWGAFVTSRLGAVHADKVIGIHVNLLTVRRDPKMLANPTPEEQHFLRELDHWLKEDTGYQWIQGTRPQTLAFGLSDSPAGLAAWIVEKFRAWSDCGGDVESVFTKDQLLADIALYWFSGAIGSSFWPYYARMHGPWPIPDAGVAVPMGYAQFPREILKPPRSVAQTMYKDIRRWSVMPRGGHFAAMEQPQALAREIVEFFRPLRGG